MGLLRFCSCAESVNAVVVSDTALILFFSFFFWSLTKNMCNFLSATPVLECAEQIFYKRGKVWHRVILLSSDFLELRAKTGSSPKKVLYCLKELKSHTAHFALGFGDKDGS